MTDSAPAAGEQISIPITQGGINNNYVSLADHIGFFPGDAIGPASEQDGSGTALTLHFAGLAEQIRTDISGRHLAFRRRGPWRRFFSLHNLSAGDSVIVERRSAYEYDIRPERQAPVEPAAPTAGREWNEAEVAEIVGDYLEMLATEARGEHYSKADHRRALQARLTPVRTLQAIEYKHANISAAMIDLGLPYIRGYKPRGNYQAALTREIRRRIQEPQVLATLRPAPRPGAPAQRLQPAGPPQPEPRKRVGRHVDYGLLQEENRRLGALGEQLVAEYEARQLRLRGRADLAERVRWAARDDGDGLGYDLLSFDANGNERHIEVKTTALGAQTPFYVSSAELDFARSHQDSYALYRVYDVATSPSFYVLQGDIADSVDLIPSTYRAQLKGPY